MPALAAIAGADVVVIGLVAMILAVATFPLYRPLIAGALSGVPVIGSWLTANADLALFRAYTSALVWIGSAVQPFADFLRAVRWSVAIHASWVGYTFGAVLVALTRIRTIYIPQAEQAAMAYAESRIGWLTVYAQTLYWQAITFAQAQAQGAIAYAESRIGWLTVYAQTLYWQAITEIQAASVADAAYAQALAGQAIGYAQQGLMDLERQMELEALQQAEFAQRIGLQAEQTAQQLAAQAEEYARALTGQAMARSDAQSSAVAQAAAASTAAVGIRVRELEDSPCQQYCKPLGELGQVLQQLAELAAPALLLAMAAEMAADPGGTAQAIDGLIGAPLRDLAQELGELGGQRGGPLAIFERVGGPALG